MLCILMKILKINKEVNMKNVYYNKCNLIKLNEDLLMLKAYNNLTLSLVFYNLLESLINLYKDRDKVNIEFYNNYLKNETDRIFNICTQNIINIKDDKILKVKNDIESFILDIRSRVDFQIEYENICNCIIKNNIELSSREIELKFINYLEYLKYIIENLIKNHKFKILSNLHKQIRRLISWLENKTPENLKSLNNSFDIVDIIEGKLCYRQIFSLNCNLLDIIKSIKSKYTNELKDWENRNFKKKDNLKIISIFKDMEEYLVKHYNPILLKKFEMEHNNFLYNIS